MIRAQLMRRDQERKDGFRLRGTDVTRLEGFSDAVFGFAVTLLVVSLQVPTNFNALLTAMSDLLPFAVRFAILCFLWYQHYLFFRRYGLHDGTMVMLNSLLLFVILAYIYPLKFLFRSFLEPLLRLPAQQAPLTPAQLPELFIIYALGWIAVYAIFALFYVYVHAYRQRVSLALSALELLDTRSSTFANLAMIGIGLLSILLAVLNIGVLIGVPGWVYFLTGPTQMLIGSRSRARRRALAEQVLSEPPSGTSKDAPAPDTSS